MIKTIRDLDLKQKKVIVRVDYNVPVKDGKIQNTKKIDDSFETIDYLLSQGSKIILLSHFGRVKTEEDKTNNSLSLVFEYLKSLNKYNVIFSNEVMGNKLDEIVDNLQDGQIVLVENTRFMDLNGKLESSCDPQLAMYWAGLAEVFVNDAFGSMHRNHASVTGIAKYLPSAIGILVEKELNGLKPLMENPQRPFTVLMGGAKLEDKIELIYSLCEKADYVLLGGGIANTFLLASGYNVGSSLVSRESVVHAVSLLKEFPDKIILPKDVICSPSYSDNTYQLKKVDSVDVDDVIGDIGSAAIQNYKRILDSSKTIFVNGTVGMYEELPFSNGTREVLDIISQNKDSIKIVGGGDASSAVKKFGYQDKMSFVSTGGGATLSYIGNGNLEGLDSLDN